MSDYDSHFLFFFFGGGGGGEGRGGGEEIRLRERVYTCINKLAKSREYLRNK